MEEAPKHYSAAFARSIGVGARGGGHARPRMRHELPRAGAWQNVYMTHTAPTRRAGVGTPPTANRTRTQGGGGLLLWAIALFRTTAAGIGQCAGAAGACGAECGWRATSHMAGAARGAGHIRAAAGKRASYPSGRIPPARASCLRGPRGLQARNAQNAPSTRGSIGARGQRGRG